MSQRKQFYYCFGCHSSGDAIDWIMAREGLSFPEAVHYLAARTGVDLSLDHEGPDHTALYALLQKAHTRFRQALRESPVAQAYCESRGITPAQALKYELGFAPEKDLFADEDPALLRQAGLLTDKGPMFRNRLMFPFMQGHRVVGWSGRTLGASRAKYLNTPETPVFKKGDCLFGQKQAAQRCAPRVALMEGFMDVLAMDHMNLAAVAPAGTAITINQMRKAFTVSKELVFMLDGDEAGRRGMERGLDEIAPLLSTGRLIRMAFLPEGDPDEWVHSGRGEELQAVIQQSLYLNQYWESLYTGAPETRAQVADRIKAFIQQMPSSSYRDELEAEFKKMGVRIPAGKAQVSPQSHISHSHEHLLRAVIAFPEALHQEQWPWEHLPSAIQPCLAALRQTSTFAEARSGLTGEARALLEKCGAVNQVTESSADQVGLLCLASVIDAALEGEIDLPDDELMAYKDLLDAA